VNGLDAVAEILS